MPERNLFVRWSIVASFCTLSLGLAGCTNFAPGDFKKLLGDATNLSAEEELNSDKYYFEPETRSALRDLKGPSESDSSTAAIVLPANEEIALQDNNQTNDSESQNLEPWVSEEVKDLIPPPGLVSQSPLKPIDFDKQARKQMGQDDASSLRKQKLITLKAQPAKKVEPSENRQSIARLQPIEPTKSIEPIISESPLLPAEPIELPSEEIVDQRFPPNHEEVVQLPVPDIADESADSSSVEDALAEVDAVVATMEVMPPFAAAPEVSEPPGHEPLVIAQEGGDFALPTELSSLEDTHSVNFDPSFVGTDWQSSDSELDSCEQEGMVPCKNPSSNCSECETNNDFEVPPPPKPVILVTAKDSTPEIETSSPKVSRIDEQVEAAGSGSVIPSTAEVPNVAPASHAEVIPSKPATPAPTLEELREKIAKMEEEAELSLVNVSFCTSVSGYGQFTPFVNNDFKAGQRLLVYCEIENFTSIETPSTQGSSFRTRLRGSFQIQDSAGETIQQKEFPVVEDVAKAKRRDFYVHLPVRIGELSPGSYRLQVMMEDLSGNKTAKLSQMLEFTVN